MISGAVIAGAGLGSDLPASRRPPLLERHRPPARCRRAARRQTHRATLTHGPNETLLTGADLRSATTAEPGATTVRAETDSGGSAYEVHMQKTDGTYATVKLDSSFTVTSTEQGFGSGPAAQSVRHECIDARMLLRSLGPFNSALRT